jgi:hypothetical protein
MSMTASPGPTTMLPPSDAPAPSGVLFPELLGASEPAPPARPRGSGLLRIVARVLLWSLIAVGALRGLLPAPEGSAPVASTSPADDRLAAAVATAFLREYLTVGDDRAARAERLGRFTAAGVDLHRSVSVPADVAQYADLVVAGGGRSVAGGTEVTVLAHVLQARSGTYRDGGTMAFVVPLAMRQGRMAVTGPPRPTSWPVDAGMSLPRPQAPPPELPPEAARIARRAVVALVAGDSATLSRLTHGRVPPVRPLPSGWRVLGVGAVEAAVAGGPAGSMTARVPVRVRPPIGQASYLVPVHVQLQAGSRGLTVRLLDLGASP